MATIAASRTLVKSPPELWRDLEDLERLSTWLGEITITRVEPGSTVEWEHAEATGTVALEQAAWGTKIMLTAETTAPEPELEPVVPAVVQPEPQMVTVRNPKQRFWHRWVGRNEAETLAVAVEPEPSPLPHPEPEPVSESTARFDFESAFDAMLDELGTPQKRPFSAE